MRTRRAPSAQELTLLMYMRHKFLMFMPRTSHFDVTNTGRTRSVRGWRLAMRTRRASYDLCIHITNFSCVRHERRKNPCRSSIAMCVKSYGVALVSRIDKIIGLFCKRDL